jgi:hypothetical protein
MNCHSQRKGSNNGVHIFSYQKCEFGHITKDFQVKMVTKNLYLKITAQLTSLTEKNGYLY